MQDQQEVKRHSGTPPRTWRKREAKLTVRGFTAGGSGITSTAAIPINRPRNQIKSAFDFMTVSPRFQRWNDASTECRHLLLLAVSKQGVEFGGCLVSYWRFEQGDAAWPRSISLTRNLPVGLGWAIELTLNHVAPSTRSRLRAKRLRLAARTNAIWPPDA